MPLQNGLASSTETIDILVKLIATAKQQAGIIAAQPPIVLSKATCPLFTSFRLLYITPNEFSVIKNIKLNKVIMHTVLRAACKSIMPRF